MARPGRVRRHGIRARYVWGRPAEIQVARIYQGKGARVRRSTAERVLSVHLGAASPGALVDAARRKQQQRERDAGNAA